MNKIEKRPEIHQVHSAEEFKRWYWLKEELVAYCRKHKLGVSGQKRELEVRIVRYLKTGQIVKPKARQYASSFDWNNATLNRNTKITDNYRNTQNMRAFMKTEVGESFRFSNEFMQWMRANTGQTLGDAVLFWIELDRKKRELGYREKPLPQNQYNQFVRALSKAKPGISNKEIRRLWTIKRSKPGPHVFKAGDEKF